MCIACYSLKAAKVLALGIVMLPIAGCNWNRNYFAALIRGLAYAPDLEETLFNYTTLGFAFRWKFCIFYYLG